jgi:hypothetical protein
METRERCEQLQRQAEQRGRVEGRLCAVARVTEKRLGRLLAEAERATLAGGLDRLGEDHVLEVVLFFPADMLTAWLVDPSKWFEEYQRQLEDRGRRRALARMFEVRLNRTLADAEQTTLAQRMDRMGEDRICDVMIALAGTTLAAWLADPSAA